MGGISSLSVAITGMNAAQAGLYVTGHNISNNNTKGYVRQQAIQRDFVSVTVGYSGSNPMQVGLGTDVTGIRQIRDNFLDISYRRSVSKGSFYETKYATGSEIENIIGELEGSYKMQDVVQNLWEAMHELELNPASIETRANFIEYCRVFVDKFNTSYDALYNYQLILNEEVKSSVQQINQLVTGIAELNMEISSEEMSGSNANDLRDKRNLYLDQLSTYIDITYTERPNGFIEIMCEGKDLLAGNNVQTQIGLRYSSPDWPFVEPVFSSRLDILPYEADGSNARPLFSFNKEVSSRFDNDNGSLKALLVSRGKSPANYSMSAGQLDPNDPNYLNDKFNAQCTIPSLQIQLDTMFHEIITLINDAVAPYDSNGDADLLNAPYDLAGNQPLLEIFSRVPPKYSQRFDGSGAYVKEDNSDYYSLYTIGNVRVNPEFDNTSGYTKIALGRPDPNDPDFVVGIHEKGVLEHILQNWNTELIGIDNNQKLGVMDFYNNMLTELSIDIHEDYLFAQYQQVLIEQDDFNRLSVMSVSLDEEARNMLVYQHAYNASARMLNVIDSMIDKIINSTGRSGL